MDPQKQARIPRDAGNWAAKVERLSVPEAVRRYGYNIEGKRLAGPPQGFGRMWQRTFSADLGHGVSPEALVADWRANFASYWPKMGRFHGSVTAIQPGDVAPLTGGGIAMGIMVLYADETSFTFLTPEGHLFAGLITFSAERTDQAATLAKISILLRCYDPIIEAVWPAMRRMEDSFWSGTLRNLAARHGMAEVTVEEQTQCVDRSRVWTNWRNIRYNVGIRSAMHAIGAPFRPRRATAVG